MRRVDPAGITRSHLAEHGISLDEAAFLRAVVKAMNGELEGYNLTESMTKIRDKYDINEGKLIEQGYLKRHSGVARRCYYSVTPDGQKACRTAKEHGFMIGDAGDDTPHRVGVELARQVYRADERRVEISPGSWVDLVVANNYTGERVATIEVEAGRITADPSTPTGASPGINDYSSIRHDYELLAEADGDAVWVVRNHEIAGTVLRALNNADDISVDLSNDVIRGVESGRVKMDELGEKYIEPMGADGLDEIVTFQQLRNRLR